MGYIAAPTDDGTVLRDCIVCGSDRADPVFTYTHAFLTTVRWHTAADLETGGWSEDRTQTVVKCRECGCHYVRDVYADYQGGARAGYSTRQELSAQQIEAACERRAALFGGPQARSLRQNAVMIADLLQLASARKGGASKVLDFGAGGAVISQLARLLGAEHVVAYDPSYPANQQEVFDRSGFGNLVACHNDEALRTHAPFGLAMCQGVIEHVIDPRAELALMFEVMAPGGILYINNPVMDLNRDLAALKAARSIDKRNPLSCYHPKHYNYMLPRHFRRLVAEIGFEVTPSVCYLAMPPMAPGFIARNLVQAGKRAVRYLQNRLDVPYRRETFILRKPS